MKLTMKLLYLVTVTAIGAFAADPDLEIFASSTRQFSAALYDELLVDNNENILVSPFSIETVLALTQSGAAGNTAEEIRSSLFLPESEEETEAVFQSVLPLFKNNAYILHTANKVYVEDGLGIKDGFKEVATDVYDAGFQNVEFSDGDEAAKTINEWVEEQTQDMIHNLISPDDLDDLTRFVLVNALFFEGNWSVPFDNDDTEKTAFYTSADTTIETKNMFQDSVQYNFYESKELDAAFLEMPFRGKDASMTIILPNQKEGIALLEKQTKLLLAAPKYTKEYVRVSIPKFKIESTIDFKPILQEMGVQTAFSSQPDFSAIAGSPGEIYISKVSQKTYIDVNEVGVQAAAASASFAGTDSGPPSPTKRFIADHPFAFYIKVNDVIIFEGRVLEPKY